MENQITSFEEACKVLNIGTELPNMESWPEDSRAQKTAEYKLETVIKALNGGWYPDWKNGNERKYWPWFYRADDGFSFNLVGNLFQYSTVGSRLCFRSEELAEYAATQFLDLYKEYMA